MIDYAARFRPRERPEGPGSKLYALRIARRLSIEDASSGADVTPMTYTDYEFGRKTAYGAYPGVVRSASRVAEFFGTTVEAIWGEDTRGARIRSCFARDAVGNARLILERASRGWSVAEAARRLGLHFVNLVQIESMTRSCIRSSYAWTPLALRIARGYQRDPAWLFADVVVRVRVRPEYDDLEVGEEFFGLQESAEDTLERRQILDVATSVLSERECAIVWARAEGETLSDVGMEWGVTRERVRQIETTALAKMRAALEAA